MTFIKRALTAIIGLPPVVVIVYFGGWPLYLLCYSAAMLGLWELYRAFDIPKPLKLAGFAFTAINFLAVFFLDGMFWEGLALYVIVLAALTVVFYGRFSFEKVIKSAFGFMYVPFLLTFVLLLRDVDYGHIWIWIIFISCFGCDTFAYLIGSAFGRRKLVNSPSPSKSVEGLVGGVIGTFALGFSIPFFVSRLPAFADSETAVFLNVGSSLTVALIASAGAVLSIIGDMFGSAIKRYAEIKDFGTIFPGHGGMLDRLDSIVVVSPFMFVVISALDGVLL